MGLLHDGNGMLSRYTLLGCSLRLIATDDESGTLLSTVRKSKVIGTRQIS